MRLFFTSVLKFFANITICTYFQATCDWMITSQSGVFGIDPTNKKNFSVCLSLLCSLSRQFTLVCIIAKNVNYNDLMQIMQYSWENKQHA